MISFEVKIEINLVYIMDVEITKFMKDKVPVLLISSIIFLGPIWFWTSILKSIKFENK